MNARKRKADFHASVDQCIRRYVPPVSGKISYWYTIAAVRATSKMLQPQQCRSRYWNGHPQAIVKAISNLMRWHRSFQRAPEFWCAERTQSPAEQFGALVSYLLDQYPLPKFMQRVWLSGEDCWEQRLYLHLAAGGSVRKFDWPGGFQPSKRTAHLFLQSPDHFTPTKAIRWAQVRSLGGDLKLANQLSGFYHFDELGKHEEFWLELVQFLVRNQPVSEAAVRDIVDFIDEQRFQPECEVLPNAVGNQPLQPDFSLKGQTLRSLRRQMAYWQEELLARRPELLHGRNCWPRLSAQPLRHQDGDAVWLIDELLTPAQLYLEGERMDHCVGSYVQDCARRVSSIWSMRLISTSRLRRLMTIEVCPERREVVQARAKGNANPSPDAVRVLKLWAEREKLEVVVNLS